MIERSNMLRPNAKLKTINRLTAGTRSIGEIKRICGWEKYYCYCHTGLFIRHWYLLLMGMVSAITKWTISILSHFLQ